MSTGSIKHNIEIANPADAERFVEALEEAERISEEGMERLTYWNGEYGCWSYKCASGDAAKRLAEYEDVELTPEQIQAQQQEIDKLKRQLSCERQTVSMLKSRGLHYGEFPKIEADELIDKLVKDKDEQAGRLMRLEEGLKKQRNFLQLLNELGGLGYQKHGWIKSHIAEIDALLGGKEE